MEGLGMTPHLQTGEMLIITTVLLLWAGQTFVTIICSMSTSAHFCFVTPRSCHRPVLPTVRHH